MDNMEWRKGAILQAWPTVCLQSIRHPGGSNRIDCRPTRTPGRGSLTERINELMRQKRSNSVVECQLPKMAFD
jgi:hypothetical protein